MTKSHNDKIVDDEDNNNKLLICARTLCASGLVGQTLFVEHVVVIHYKRACKWRYVNQSATSADLHYFHGAKAVYAVLHFSVSC